MTKKKLNIFLLLLLPVLFIVLYSTSYAYSYTITDSDIDTIFTGLSMGSTWNNLKTYTKNYKNTIYSNYDTCVIAINYYSSRYYIYMYGFNSSSVTNVTSPNSVNYMGVTLSSNGVFYQLSPSSQNYNTIQVTTNAAWTGGANFGTGSQNRTRYLVVSNDLGDNLFTGPWQSSDILTFTPPAPTYLWEVNSYESYLTQVSVQNYGSTCYYAPRGSINYAGSSYFTPCYLMNYSQLGYLEKKYLAYNYNNEYWYVYYRQNYYNFDYSGDFYVDTEYDALYCRESKENVGENIIVYTFYPKEDSDFDYVVQFYLYLGSRYTYIHSGDYIDLDTTFTGTNGNGNNGYLNQYDNQNNTNQVKNDLYNEQDNQDGFDMVDGLVTGDYEEMYSSYAPYKLPNSLFQHVFGYLGRLIDTLYNRSDVYFDFSLHGETPTRIYSSDIYVPDGVLKTFIMMFMVTCVIRIMYLQIFTIYEKIATLDLVGAVRELDINKSIYRM